MQNNQTYSDCTAEKNSDVMRVKFLPDPLELQMTNCAIHWLRGQGISCYNEKFQNLTDAQNTSNSIGSISRKQIKLDKPYYMAPYNVDAFIAYESSEPSPITKNNTQDGLMTNLLLIGDQKTGPAKSGRHKSGVKGNNSLKNILNYGINLLEDLLLKAAEDGQNINFLDANAESADAWINFIKKREQKLKEFLPPDQVRFISNYTDCLKYLNKLQISLTQFRSFQVRFRAKYTIKYFESFMDIKKQSSPFVDLSLSIIMMELIQQLLFSTKGVFEVENFSVKCPSYQYYLDNNKAKYGLWTYLNSDMGKESIYRIIQATLMKLESAAQNIPQWPDIENVVKSIRTQQTAGISYHLSSDELLQGSLGESNESSKLYLSSNIYQNPLLKEPNFQFSPKDFLMNENTRTEENSDNFFSSLKQLPYQVNVDFSAVKEPKVL